MMKYRFEAIRRTDVGVYSHDIKHFSDINEAKEHFINYKANTLSKFGVIVESKVLIESEYEEYILHQSDPKGNEFDQTVILLLTFEDGDKLEDAINIIDSESLYCIYISMYNNNIITSQNCYMSGLTLHEAIQIQRDLFNDLLANIKSDDKMYRLDNESRSRHYCSIKYTNLYTNNTNLWTCTVIRQDHLRGVNKNWITAFQTTK